MKYFLLSLIIVIAQPLAAQEMLGFVGGWRMDSNCQLIDISNESSADGVLIDMSITANRHGTPNSALSFGQSTSYVALGATEKFALPNDKSISFWIRPVPVSNRIGSIFWFGANGIVIGYEQAGSNLRLNLAFGGTLYMTRNLTANQWQHITITFQKDFTSTRSKAFYYVNGELSFEADMTKSVNDFTNSIALLGPQNQNTLTNGFRGSLDDLKIYNRTLTAAEVSNLALPVTLEFFRASRSGATTELSWRTQLEENVSHFELQKSTDGIAFSKITDVAAGKYNYVAYDASPARGMTWYRLKVVDIDGKVTYSNVVRSSTDDDAAPMKFFPNPVSRKLQLIGPSAYGQVTIVNNSGMVVKKQTLANNTIDVSELKAGLYYIIFFDGNKRVSSKFTKL